MGWKALYPDTPYLPNLFFEFDFATLKQVKGKNLLSNHQEAWNMRLWKT